MEKRQNKRRTAIFMVFIMFLSVLLPVMPAPTGFAVDTSSDETVTNTSTERLIEFTYIREDQEYGDWNIWVWNTGVQDDEINFNSYENGVAVANIAVAADTKEIGFVLRSTHDWETAEKEFGDRLIQVSENDSITKVKVTSGVEEIDILPDGSAPTIDNGNATFYYRDKDLFASDAMDTITKVELKFNGQTNEMTYEPENERFVYTYQNIPTGTNEYSFLVTKDGSTTEVTDPYNTVNGVSEIAFNIADVTLSGTVNPGTVDYNQNAVLTVNTQATGGEISKIYADTSALGGPTQIEIDPALGAITIAVADDVTAGTKQIPLTAVDSFGNTHEGTAAQVEVTTRQSVGEADFDWDESVIYFMLTDRFFDGDATNNDPYGMNYDTNYRGTYQGGDFDGITTKLEYLDALGVNTIWISPIVENIKYDVRYNATDANPDQPYYAYHGYWGSNFGELNPHFGTITDFHELIDAAHDRGIKIMVDVVVNHTGYGLKDIDGTITDQPAGYPTDEDRARFSNLVRQGSNVGTDEVVGELAGLPDFITEDPVVRQQIIDWQTSWIEKATTPNGNTIDYFRVDTVKHVEDATWMAFKNAITSKMPEFKMIGEAWGANQADDQGYLDSGMMDSLLDFGFKDTARNFVNGDLVGANSNLQSRNVAIDNTATLGQFLGSHDEGGFLDSVGGDQGKLKVAASLQATAKGQPVIYYGEELGLSGAANYPFYDNRYNISWDQIDGNEVLAHYQKIYHFRSNNSAIFAKGDRTEIGGTNADKFLLFSRSYASDSVYVGLSVADTPKEVTVTVDTPGAVVTDNYSGTTFTANDAGEATVTIPSKADGGTVLLTVDNGAILDATVPTIGETPENTIRIHYQRTDNVYDNFGAWLWGDVVSPSEGWPTGATMFESTDDYGAYIDVPIADAASSFGFLIMDVTQGDAGKDGGDKTVTVTEGLTEIWIKQGSDEVFTSRPVDEIPENHIRIHYQRDNADYDNYGAWLWNDVSTPSAGWPTGATMFEKFDDYGAYIDVELAEGAENIGFLVMDVTQGDAGKDGGDKGFTISSPEMNEIWIKQGSDEVFTFEPIELPENTVRIHYVRDNADYENFGAWIWGDDVVAPSTDWPTGASMFTNTDQYGAYIDVAMKESAKQIGFLVMDVTQGDTGKDGGDKNFNLLDRYNRIWIKQGDDNVYVSPYWEVATGISSAEILSDTKLLLGFTMTEGLDAETLKNDLVITDANDAAVTINTVEITGENTVELTADFDLNAIPLSVTFMGKTVSANTGWRMLDEMYSYGGDDLGATYHEDGSATLKLWAPKASEVVANFYDKNDAATAIGSIALTLGEQGVWELNANPADLGVEDLDGYYYQYAVTNGEVTRKVLDPYAKSMAAFTVNTNGEAGPDGDTVGKAAIVDLSGTNPEGFTHAEIDGYEKREDAIIYEVHVRDFTSDPSIEGDLTSRWGTYSAFIDKLEYIKSMGVTHVQLLPVMAWYYGDETAMGERELEFSAGGNEYNWGYDPHSYFAPDGAYSLDPKDAELRVKELKELIDAIHDAGMGVVLDVVYTHMAKTSHLNDIVPNYYAFQDADGNFLGGFGNNLATNRKMSEKLMVDSIKYWFDEYKVDGMRFDMMGDASYPAVQNAVDAAQEINPNALFIGEGWRTFAGHIDTPSLEGMGADQDWMDKTDDVGVFSDEIRNELKSGFGSEGEPRFLTGGARSIETIFNNIKGQPGNTADDDPGDMVQYIAAHDNLPLYDVIAQSIKKDPSVSENNLEIHKRVRLGNALVLTSQGTAFIHAGQEYGRTKQWFGEGEPEQKSHELTDANGNPFGYFIHDSYDSSDAINMFDWEKVTNADEYAVNVTTKEFTQGLIELRKSTNAFRLGSKDLVDQNVTLLDIPEISANDLVIGYKSVATDDTGVYYTFVNADNAERTLTLANLDLTKGKVLVDSDEAGTVEVSDPTGFDLSEGTITLDPLTTVVVKVAPIDECFIATASFGSKFTPSVTLLRNFRDDFLLTNKAGTVFVDFYYTHSPKIADVIRGNEFLKASVRVGLSPLVGMTYLAYHPTLAGLLMLTLIGTVVFMRRRKNQVTL